MFTKLPSGFITESSGVFHLILTGKKAGGNSGGRGRPAKAIVHSFVYARFRTLRNFLLKKIPHTGDTDSLDVCG